MGQCEMSRSGIFGEEIRHLVRLCLREAGSSTALIFKFHTLASDSDAICNFFWKKMEAFEILHSVSYRTPKLSLSLSLLIVLLLRELNIFICKRSLLLT